MNSYNTLYPVLNRRTKSIAINRDFSDDKMIFSENNLLAL